MIVEHIQLISDNTCLAYGYYDDNDEYWIDYIDLEDSEAGICLPDLEENTDE